MARAARAFSHGAALILHTRAQVFSIKPALRFQKDDLAKLRAEMRRHGNRTVYECVQRSGDVIMVPSGWSESSPPRAPSELPRVAAV